MNDEELEILCRARDTFGLTYRASKDKLPRDVRILLLVAMQSIHDLAIKNGRVTPKGKITRDDNTESEWPETKQEIWDSLE